MAQVRGADQIPIAISLVCNDFGERERVEILSTVAKIRRRTDERREVMKAFSRPVKKTVTAFKVF
jgi:hypothetical protein